MQQFRHIGKLGMKPKKEIQDWLRQLKSVGIYASYASLKKMFEVEAEAEVYVNDIYTVTKADAVQAEMVQHRDGGWPPMWYLSIKRNDKEVIWDWRELQEIKNLICGESNEGMQLFPAESRVVDTVNQYHLFVLKEPNLFIPVGFPTREVSDSSLPNTKQRTFASK